VPPLLDTQQSADEVLPIQQPGHGMEINYIDAISMPCQRLVEQPSGLASERHIDEPRVSAHGALFAVA
jgi:hypothetical protein